MTAAEAADKLTQMAAWTTSFASKYTFGSSHYAKERVKASTGEAEALTLGAFALRHNELLKYSLNEAEQKYEEAMKTHALVVAVYTSHHAYLGKEGVAGKDDTDEMQTYHAACDALSAFGASLRAAKEAGNG